MVQNSENLRHYRNTLLELRSNIPELQKVPATFDGMIQNFGQKVQRQELCKSYDQKCR